MSRKSQIPSDARAALGSAAILIVLATLIEDGTVGLLAGVPAFLLIAFAMTRMPLRHSLMGLTFFATVLPNPGEGQPTSWNPPFTYAGQALLNHLNTLDRGGVLGMVPVSAMELFFLVLFLVHRRRKATRSQIDQDIVPVPQPLVQMAKLALCAAGFTWLQGMLFGGQFGMSLWQLNAVLYLPCIFLLCCVGLRGPEDCWNLAKVYLIAGTYKSLLALYVVATIVLPPDELTGSTAPPYATAHADSQLFSLCFVIVIAGLLERTHRRWPRLAAVLLPLLLLGTKANNRRLAWVELAIVLLILYFVSRETRLKRFIRRAVVASVPLAIGYVVAGWNSQYGGLFKPVRMFRSVVEANSDGSSQWREIENYDLIQTFSDHPIFGTGYGTGFTEFVALPAVEYSLERYLPHNSFLGLWTFAGPVGVFGITTLWVGGLYFAMRAYHAAENAEQSTAAICCFAALPIYLGQCFGDLGLASWTGMFMVAVSAAMSGKLAVVSNQCPVVRSSTSVAPEPAPRKGACTVGKLLLMSFMIAMIAVPTKAARDADPRRGLERVVKHMAIAAAVYAFILKFVWKHFA